MTGGSDPWWTDERNNVRCTACGWKGYRYTFQPVWIGPSWLGKRNPEWEQAITRKPCRDCGGRVEVND